MITAAFFVSSLVGSSLAQTTTVINAELWGGGGGAGGGDDCDNVARCFGGDGGYLNVSFDCHAGEVITVTVATGGQGPTGVITSTGIHAINYSAPQVLTSMPGLSILASAGAPGGGVTSNLGGAGGGCSLIRSNLRGLLAADLSGVAAALLRALVSAVREVGVVARAMLPRVSVQPKALSE